MSAAFDHVFVMCSAGAPEADVLREVGLVEGSPNFHPGQGTSCRRFFFRNGYLELLWVENEEEVRSEPIRPTRLWERWSGRDRGACPFGVVVRPANGDVDSTPPFPAWRYAPAYLPDGAFIGIAMDASLEEPEFFYLAFQRGRARGGQEPTDHKIPAQFVTGVKIGAPGTRPRSTAASAVEASGWLSFHHSTDHLLHLTFDANARGGAADLRPALPLVLSW